MISYVVIICPCLGISFSSSAESYQGLHQAAREIQVVPNAIFQAVKNGRQSKGYYWKYVTDEKD